MVKKTTANEPVGAIDPGGTRPAKPPPGQNKSEPTQKVQSGDRNTMKTQKPVTRKA